MLLKKITALTIAAAFILTGPGQMAVQAAAVTFIGSQGGVNIGGAGGAAGAGVNRGGVSQVPLMGPNGLGLNSILPSNPGVSPVAATPSVLVSPVSGVIGAMASPAVVPAVGVVSEGAGAAQAGPLAPMRAVVERLSQAPAIQTLQKSGPEASDADRRQALDATFDLSIQKPGQIAEIQGTESAAAGLLGRSSVEQAKRASAVERLAARAESSKGKSGSLIAEIGIVAAVATVLGAIFSPSFRNHLKRMGQVLLGLIGMGVKKAETAEVMAQRIVDQLNANKPVYNQKVQQASTLTEKIAIQVRDEKAKVAELEKTINALLSDKDDSNDHLAAGMIAAQKSLEGSIAASNEQLKLAQASLEEIKAERTRFFQEREEMLAKVNAQLTRSKSAEIQKQMAELKGGFQVGDIKDSMDRLNDIVNEKEAEAKGSKDATESNPDEIIKKAKESVMSSEVKDEIARRKAEIARKQQEGKDKSGSLAP